MCGLLCCACWCGYDLRVYLCNILGGVFKCYFVLIYKGYNLVLKKIVGGCGFCSSFLGICHIKIFGFLELGCDP